MSKLFKYIKIAGLSTLVGGSLIFGFKKYNEYKFDRELGKAAAKIVDLCKKKMECPVIDLKSDLGDEKLYINIEPNILNTKLSIIIKPDTLDDYEVAISTFYKDASLRYTYLSKARQKRCKKVYKENNPALKYFPPECPEVTCYVTILHTRNCGPNELKSGRKILEEIVKGE